MPNTTYLLIAILSLMFIMLILFGVYVFLYNKHKKIEEEIDRHEINLGATIDKDIPLILDTIILEVFKDYRIMSHLELDNEYINEEKEQQIRDDLVRLVSERISDDAIDKVSVFYKKENISDVVADKIYIAVVNFVIERNRKYISKT